MPQTRESGAAANAYGHSMARIIAGKIGAVSLTDHSNEFAYDGQIVTIRCAQLGDNQVGVLYTMLQRIDLVIGAFEEESGDIQTHGDVSPPLQDSTPRFKKRRQSWSGPEEAVRGTRENDFNH